MKPTMIMVRYGELSTKGKNINQFIKRLAQNIQSALSQYEQVKVQWQRDRTYIYLHGADSQEIIQHLQYIFGIQTLSPVIELAKDDIEDVKQAAVQLVRPLAGAGKTFKVSTRRADHDYPYNTMEMNRLLGEAVGRAYPELTVKMDNPDITVYTEIRQGAIYLYTEIIDGLGGMPVGSAGKGMLMLSGGIDSPVAGYLAMKRGVNIEAVHFASPPYTSPQALQKTKDLTSILARYSGSIQFLEVPFTEIQEAIKKHIPEGYLMTVTRRMMMRLVDAIRQQRHGLAIINGESLGQVASQTLESMVAINAVTVTPVLRPLVSMDKTEIVEIAEKIGTYELSILPYEDCCTIFTPPKPKTKPNLERVEEYEKALDIDGLIERSLAGIQVESIGINQQSDKINEMADLL